MGVALGVGLVSLATPLVSATVRSRWFDFPGTLWVMVLPAAIFVLAFAGLAYSLYPYIVIDRMTIREAAAHPSALRALLLGAAIVLPFIAGYTILSYRIFRGKAKAGLYD